MNGTVAHKSCDSLTENGHTLVLAYNTLIIEVFLITHENIMV